MTHFLETASAETSQDTERKQPGEEYEDYSHAGDRISRNKSGHGKKATEQGTLTFWRPIG